MPQYTESIIKLMDEFPNGYKGELAIRAGVTQPTISKFFNRGNLQSSTFLAIVKPMVAIINEYNSELNSIVAAVKR